MQIHSDLKAVLDFWFSELTPKDWFSGGAAVDTMIKERFGDTHTKVSAGEYWESRTTPEAFLAEVIVLDQFSRNLFRGSGQSFAYDGQALLLSQTAIAAGYDQSMNTEQKQFLYMPYMHSESRVIHNEALNLFEALGNDNALQYEKVHKAIIDQFGRYPHRNTVLGRESTPEEVEYLANIQEDFF